MIIAGTGHRPDKLCIHPSMNDQAVHDWLVSLAMTYLAQMEPDMVISGMALGWDQALAKAAMISGVPFIAAVPFSGQERRWPASDQAHYHSLLAAAHTVEVVSSGDYEPVKMEIRNRWMVNRAHRVVALWDGSPGGTGNCIRYARKRKAEIDNLWTRWAFCDFSLDLLI